MMINVKSRLTMGSYSSLSLRGSVHDCHDYILPNLGSPSGDGDENSQSSGAALSS
jgi:hypothetical protein